MADIYIKNETKGYKYVFKGTNDADDGVASGTIKIPLPGEDEPMMLNLGGQMKTLSFGFAVFLRSDDTADGTFTSTVKTIKEQRAYLLKSLNNKAEGDKYKMYWADYLDDAGMHCMIDDLRIRPIAGGMNFPGKITITFGENTL